MWINTEENVLDLLRCLVAFGYVKRSERIL